MYWSSKQWAGSKTAVSSSRGARTHGPAAHQDCNTSNPPAVRPAVILRVFVRSTCPCEPQVCHVWSGEVQMCACLSIFFFWRRRDRTAVMSYRNNCVTLFCRLIARSVCVCVCHRLRLEWAITVPLQREVFHALKLLRKHCHSLPVSKAKGRRGVLIQTRTARAAAQSK